MNDQTPTSWTDMSPEQKGDAIRSLITVDSPFLFCGDTALRGKVYCSAHHAIAFKPRIDGRKETA